MFKPMENVCFSGIRKKRFEFPFLNGPEKASWGCSAASPTTQPETVPPRLRRGVRLSKKAKKEKKRPGKKLAVAKPCIFAQQSAGHAANAAKKGW